MELSIDGLAAGGDGVGRAPDGRVVFVPFTAPGDRVRVRIDSDRARFARGTVETLLSPGPGRTDPVCGVFGSCGGCAWQHVGYAAQLDAKREIVESALERIGRISLTTPIEVMPSPRPYGYRSRSRVLVAGGRVGYRRRRSHVLCATNRCPLLVPELDSRLAQLAQDPPADGEWELAAGVGADGAVDTRVSALPAGPGDRLWLEIGGDRIGFSPGVFVQSNASLLEALASAVFEAAGSGDLAVDAFAGAGFFTLGLARRFGRLFAVEANPDAARDLELNCEDAAITNVTTVCERVEAFFTTESADRADVVVLDPPRTGLLEGAAEQIADSAPRRVVYLSCDPATLARDLSVFDHYRYGLTHVEAFDLFPQTPHVEVLAVAERG